MSKPVLNRTKNKIVVPASPPMTWKLLETSDVSLFQAKNLIKMAVITKPKRIQLEDYSQPTQEETRASEKYPYIYIHVCIYYMYVY